MSAIPLHNSSGSSVRWKKSPSSRPSCINSAESASGRVTFELWDRVQKEKMQAVTTAPDNIRLERELDDILQEFSSQDWDGYDAKPIDRNSVQHVCQFLEQLPSDISYPELAPEPTGDLTMAWRKKGYHLIIWIDSAKQIAWGGTSPKGHVYGDAKFDSEIPEELINLLYSVEGIR